MTLIKLIYYKKLKKKLSNFLISNKFDYIKILNLIKKTIKL